MDPIKSKVKAFLKQQGMDHEDINTEVVCGVFLDEMQKGLAGRGSSLAMLPTYIETERQIPKDTSVIVMDAGGTNFRVATVSFAADGTAKIENRQLFQMPGIKATVGKDGFFRIMAGYMEQVAGVSESVGFCFSYPIEMYPTKDGRVLYFSKEIQAPEVEKQMIGENLNAAIVATGGRSKNMVLLNDTVATLLAGRSGIEGRDYDSYIGFILGTGTNCSYIEQNTNITKAADLDPGASQIVNVESGGFGRAPRGGPDERFDAAQASPGVNVFEKMISGAYLGPVCLWTAKEAAGGGLFSKEAAGALSAIDEIGTRDVNDFMSYPHGANPLAKAVRTGDETDATTLYYLVDRLVERAAKLTAINLSSVAIKSGKGTNPCKPICIVAEGTTFYHMRTLKPRVEHYLKTYLEDQKGIYTDIIEVEDATLIGAAIAGLTN